MQYRVQRQHEEFGSLKYYSVRRAFHDLLGCSILVALDNCTFQALFQSKQPPHLPYAYQDGDLCSCSQNILTFLELQFNKSSPLHTIVLFVTSITPICNQVQILSIDSSNFIDRALLCRRGAIATVPPCDKGLAAINNVELHDQPFPLSASWQT